MATLNNTSSKEDVQRVEKADRHLVPASALSEEDEDFLASFPPDREAKIYQKVRISCAVRRGHAS